MLKFCGLLSIFFFFTMGGYFFAIREKERIERVEGLVQLIRTIRQGAEFLRTPLFDIYRHFSNDALQKSGFLSVLRENGLEDTYSLFGDCFLFDAFTEGRFQVFLQTVGKLPLEEQIRSCEYTEGVLDEFLKKIKEEYPVKKKLYSALGTALGIGVVILLI